METYNSMMSTVNVVLKDIGLDKWPPFIWDRLFWFATAAGVFVWILIWLTVAPTFTIQDRSITAMLLATVIYYPVLEEILFRGIIQGRLSSSLRGKKKYLGLSVSNWITSFLFVVAHFWFQPVLWALMIIAPSLVYGYFRDRYSSIYPSIILHACYNTGFVLVNLMSIW